MPYQVQLNLQQTAAQSAAILVWEKKEVKERVAEFFSDCGKFKMDDASNEWHKLTKIVVKECYKDVLPSALIDECIHIVKLIGEKIYNWYIYIKHENESQYGLEEKAINYIDKIYWTPYGTIDEVETLKSFWLENSSLNVTKVYNLACSYALEEHINDLWNKIPKDIQDNCYNDIYNSFDRHILAYWKCRRDNDLPNLIRYFEESVSNLNNQVFNLIYDRNWSTEENMLRLSVHQGHKVAMTYFWEKLTEEEKNRSVLECARITVKRYNFYEEKDRRNIEKWIGGYKKEKYVEICIFLINQMTKDDKKSFFNEEIELNVGRSMYIERIDIKDEVLRMILSVWPWQELFMPVLKDMLQYQDNYSKMVCMFLDTITEKMVKNHQLGYDADTNKYQSLLHEAWLIVPGTIKQKIVREYSKFDFICNLIDLWDLDSLKLILNDPEIAAERDAFIDFGLFSYQEFIQNDQFERLDQLIEEIFKSEEEKKRFKQEINIWEDLIRTNQFHLADKLLEWSCRTSEEKQSLKSSIDHVRICKDFIRSKEFDLAEKFLNWKFETEEEKKNYKNSFKNDMFSIKQVYKIWKYCETNIDKAKETSTQFLRWFLESDEEIMCFKKEKLVNSELNELTFPYLVILNKNGSMNEFLSWCLLPNEEIQRITQLVSPSL